MKTPIVGSSVIRALLTRSQDKSFFKSILKSFAKGSNIETDTMIDLLQKSLDD